MKNKDQHSYNNGLKLITFSLAVFFTVLAIIDEFKEPSKNGQAIELVSETKIEVAVFPTSLVRPTTSKLTKLERLEVKTTVCQVFGLPIRTAHLEPLANSVLVLSESIGAVFFKSEIFANAP